MKLLLKKSSLNNITSLNITKRARWTSQFIAPSMTAFIVTLAMTLLTSRSHAYLTVGESAEVNPTHIYKAGIEPQIRLSDGGGLNLTGFFDRVINDSSSFRVHAGVGDTDFYTGASYKLIPYPDFNDQPAMGGRVSAIFGREGSENFYTFRVEPLISKKFDSPHGLFTPYGAIPLMFTNYKSKTETQVQLTGGVEYSNPQLPKLVFTGELGLNIKDSISYVSASVTMFLDDLKVRTRK